ncbi:MAG: ribonuclease D [Gammaproteobacteria bacterium]|nr:ribonuclease D [Gammaproteobacteria bacterium]
MPDYQYVNQPDTLAAQLPGDTQLAVDTEFMREKTYFAQLCLVQIATRDEIFCVDPLTDNPQDEFWTAMLGGSWVVHSARQDIEVISQTAGGMPREIFDTQVAAGLLGMSPQIGYAGLMKELFDVDMAKSHTRSDWTRRPLPEAVLQYAAEDVEYLLPAAEVLGEKLQQEGRLDWARQDSRLLLDPSLYEISGDQAIDRLKGARNFRGRKRAAATRLAAWREKEAIKRNRPRQWIIRDNVLADIAYNLPQSTGQLADIQGVPQKLVTRAGDALVAELAASENDQNGYQPPRPPDESQKALLKEMQSQVAECAKDLGLAAETVASKRELSAIILSGGRDSRVFQGWRLDLIGARLQQLL